jgi:CIC family chloride channel protein
VSAPSYLVRLRLRLLERFRFSDTHAMLAWAALVGVTGAGATIAFRGAIDGLEWLVTRHSGGLVEIAESLPRYARIGLPVLGGVIAGALLQMSRRWASGGPASDYMEAISIGSGRIGVRESLARSASSLFSVVSGGSIGREGSMVQLAAMCASAVGRLAGFNPARLRLLVACGAAAGITSAYSAPIGGALFVSEIVLGSFSMESFGPLLIASVAANVTMREISGYEPPYQMPPFPAVAGVELLAFLVLGVIAGALAPQYLRALGAMKAGFRRLSLPLPVSLGLGGLVVGLISAYVPEVWGNGYTVVNSLLHGPWLWTAVLLVLVAKILATAATTGSGAIGGMFTPTLFVGASLGDLFGQAAHALWPHATSMPYAFAIVGMGAFIAATTHAPLMAILMIFEMTLSYPIILPLMLACVVAYFVARLGREASMYEVTIHRNQEERALARWRGLSIAELIKPARPLVPVGASFGEVEHAFLEHPVRYVYVVDEAQRFQGVIALQDIKRQLLAREGAEPPHAGALMTREFQALTPQASLGDALQMFLAQGSERLPVIKSAEDRELLGVVSRSELLFQIEQIAGR